MKEFKAKQKPILCKNLIDKFVEAGSKRFTEIQNNKNANTHRKLQKS